jgi:hypothetical protein
MTLSSLSLPKEHVPADGEEPALAPCSRRVLFPGSKSSKIGVLDQVLRTVLGSSQTKRKPGYSIHMENRFLEEARPLLVHVLRKLFAAGHGSRRWMGYALKTWKSSLVPQSALAEGSILPWDQSGKTNSLSKWSLTGPPVTSSIIALISRPSS